MVFPEHSHPGNKDEIEEIGPGFFRITLAWSKEALEQAGSLLDAAARAFFNEAKDRPCRPALQCLFLRLSPGAQQ